MFYNVSRVILDQTKTDRMKSACSLLTCLFLLTFSPVFSQTQGIAYPAVGKGVATTFVTDYHCLGINTSALGWGTGYDKKRFTSGSTEFNLGIYSDSLNVDKLRSLFKAIRQDVFGNETTPATWEQQRQNALDYLNAGVAVDFQYNWLGFAFQNEKFGGVAFNIREDYSWYSKMNENTTDLIFNGRLSSYFDSLTVVFGTDTSTIANNQNYSDDTLNAVINGTISVPLNLSQLTNGTEVRLTWNRYYNFGYGRKIFGSDSTFALYGGIGGRFIQSMAMFNMVSDGNDFYVYSSITPNFDIDYGSIANMNPSTFTQNGGLPKPVGLGYGLDFSASAILFNTVKIGAAVNNIGAVTYKRNVYRVRDTLAGTMSLGGLSDYNITDAVYNFLEDGGLLELQGQEEYKLKNAATYRFGASVQLGKIAHLGLDIVGPFDSDNPGSLENAVFSFGGGVRPAKWVEISAGYLGGGLYKHNIPVGINFILGGGTYEFGISSRDALTFIFNGSNSVSTAFGFARVRF